MILSLLSWIKLNIILIGYEKVRLKQIRNLFKLMQRLKNYKRKRNWWRRNFRDVKEPKKNVLSIQEIKEVVLILVVWTTHIFKKLLPWCAKKWNIFDKELVVFNAKINNTKNKKQINSMKSWDWLKTVPKIRWC